MSYTKLEKGNIAKTFENSTMKTTKKQIAEQMIFKHVIGPSKGYFFQADEYTRYEGKTGSPVQKIEADGTTTWLNDYCTRKSFIDAVYEDLNK